MLGVIAFPIILTLCYLNIALAAGSLSDVNHVVLFMQENRAFDHVCDGNQKRN